MILSHYRAQVSSGSSGAGYSAGLTRTNISLYKQLGPVGLQCFGIGGDVREHLARSLAKWRELQRSTAGVK